MIASDILVMHPICVQDFRLICVTQTLIKIKSKQSIEQINHMF